MEKGVWQGDPLTPFLFILAAEGLNVAFREAQRSNLFKGVRFDNSEEEVPLLQFADDAIIMGEWEQENAKNLGGVWFAERNSMELEWNCKR